MGWKFNSRLVGCSCNSDDRISVLSWLPVRAAAGLVYCLKVVRFVPAVPGLHWLVFAVDAVVNFLDALEPVLAFVFDLLFSVGIAEGLHLFVQMLNSRAQHKLVWMSMSVGRQLRGGNATITDAKPVGQGAAPQQAEAGAAPSADLVRSAPESSSPAALPTWNEDGTWSLFDT